VRLTAPIHTAKISVSNWHRLRGNKNNPAKRANIRLYGNHDRTIGEEYMLRHVTTLLSLCTATMLAALVAAQQAYPSKPVRLIVPLQGRQPGAGDGDCRRGANDVQQSVGGAAAGDTLTAR